MRAAAGALLAAAAVAAGCASNTDTRTTPVAAVKPYAMTPTRACLRADGATVSAVRPSDRRLQAFGDLAQRNSIEARSTRGLVALAFTRSDRDAQLLAELLRVPKDPYRLLVRRNAVVFALRSAPRAMALALGCLRS
jgi:hypothetical protein